MGSTFADGLTGMGLGNQRVLAQIDKLRELNVGHMVSLPQLVVVGDQSSGKSSVLESLTGFSFPRATGLCTRYATTITCSRENHTSVTISIIPRPDADKETQERLRDFHHCVEDIRTADFAAIFDKANRAMGIRPASSDKDSDEDDTGFVTFSEDTLKIEITGPDQEHLTVIDVPGIFRTATPGQTTESDIQLVDNMVKNYIKDSRTIILAVIPCNVDIATQEILKLAKDADENGVRTMGVLTKPDLVVEQATQKAVLDLIQGKRNDLKLGYCVVKNKGADEDNVSLATRHRMEKAFFKNEPWSRVSSSGRVGIDALKKRLSELLVDISRREYPKVKVEIQKMLNRSSKTLAAMGVSRGDEISQRAFLGGMAARFEKVAGYALNAYYTEDPIFQQDSSMKLITRIIELNETFAKELRLRGHAHHFDEPTEMGGDQGKHKEKSFGSFPMVFDFYDEVIEDLHDIIVMEVYNCPEPTSNSIMDHINDVFDESRGPELGTVSLRSIFNDQALIHAAVWRCSSWHGIQGAVEEMGASRAIPCQQCHMHRPSIHPHAPPPNLSGGGCPQRALGQRDSGEAPGCLQESDGPRTVPSRGRAGRQAADGEPLLRHNPAEATRGPPEGRPRRRGG